jgi:hypothetical protein
MSNARLPDRLGPKRLKIAVACDSCRASKKKCDGARPACNQCQRKHTPCSYRNDSTGADGTAQAANTTVAASSAIRYVPPNRHPHAALPGQALLPDAEPPDPDGTQSADPPSGAVHGVFAIEVKEALDAKMGIPPACRKTINLTPMKDAPLFDLRLEREPGDSSVDTNGVLPHRRHADHLVDLFWQHIQPVEPILEQALFTRSYEALFAGRPLLGGADERVFLSTLNVVFALATQLREGLPADERNMAGNTYFRRAQAMLRVETALWEPGSLEVVQCLLLMARYLQCSSFLHQTWMVVGIAVRIAQSIGLDRPNSPPGDSLGRVPRHFREQLWQCCVYVDRMVSWMTGRAPMVLLHGLPHRAARENSPQGGDQTAAYLTKTMELYEISNHISFSHLPLRSSIPDHLGLPPLYRLDDHFSNVSRYDGCMDRWADGLPQSLRYNHLDRRVDPISYKQALLLRLRFLHSRVTLLRPMLARHCLSRIPAAPNDSTADRSGSLNPRIVQDCAAVCVENAQNVIALIVDECSPTGYPDTSGEGAVASAGAEFSSGSGIIPWWYRVFYLHVAAIVLMAATLQPNLCTPAVSESWTRAMAALRAHEHLSPFVSQCLTTFETLSAGMGAHNHQSPHVPPVTEERAPGDLDSASMPPLHDVLFQDVAFETEAMFFGMEDGSWMNNFPFPL